MTMPIWYLKSIRCNHFLLCIVLRNKRYLHSHRIIPTFLGCCNIIPVTTENNNYAHAIMSHIFWTINDVVSIFIRYRPKGIFLWKKLLNVCIVSQISERYINTCFMRWLEFAWYHIHVMSALDIFLRR